MKVYQKFAAILSVFFFAGAGLALAGEGDKCCAPQGKLSPQFIQVKELIGKWEGTSSSDEKQKVVLEYQLTAGGTALVEKQFPGTPHEMISVYHDKNGHLAMTHYCMLGNQPNLSLQNAEKDKLEFVMAGHSGIRSAKEPHMHALILTWKDKDHIVQEWAMYENGKKKQTITLTLARVQG